MAEPKTIKIDEVEYIRKDDVSQPAKKLDGMEYVVIRTYSAGVHAGYLKSREGKVVELVNTRRLWYWSGAFTLSAIAKNGLGNPENCKFSVELDSITLTEAIEIIPCTEKARESIQSIKAYE